MAPLLPVESDIEAPVGLSQPKAPQSLPINRSKNNKRLSTRIGQSLLVIMITLLFLEGMARVIAVVGEYNPQTSDEFLLKEQIAERRTQKPSIVFMGSSYTASAVYADMLATHLQNAGIDFDVKNLAMHGTGAAPTVQLKLLQSAIDSGNKPAAVFYDVSPLLGYLSARFENHPELSSFSPYLFVYRSRLARLLRTLPGILTSPHTVSAAGFGVKILPQSTKGWNPNLEAATDQSMASSIQLRHSLSDNYSSRPEFFKALEPLQNFCSVNNIKLILVYYPTTPGSDSVYQSLGLTDQQFVNQCTDIASKWQVKFVNLHRPLERMYFADCDHINAAGACLITQKLLQLIHSGEFPELHTATNK